MSCIWSFSGKTAPVTALIAAGGSPGRWDRSNPCFSPGSSTFLKPYFSREEARSLKTSCASRRAFELSFLSPLTGFFWLSLGGIGSGVLIPPDAPCVPDLLHQILWKTLRSVYRNGTSSWSFFHPHLPHLLLLNAYAFCSRAWCPWRPWNRSPPKLQTRTFLFAWSFGLLCGRSAGFFFGPFSVSCFSDKTAGIYIVLAVFCVPVLFIQILCLPAFFTDFEDSSGCLVHSSLRHPLIRSSL